MKTSTARNNTAPAAPARDHFADITARITAALESGQIPWRKPWTGCRSGAISYATGKPYSLMNQLFMFPGEYATFSAVKAAGGRVKKGAKASTVYFWKASTVTFTVKDETGAPVLDADGKEQKQIKSFPVIRAFHVFNVERDCEGIAPRWTGAGDLPTEHAEPVEAAEAVRADYCRRSGVSFHQVRGDRACYSPAADTVTVPLMEQFDSTAEYYSTTFHELTHSTGHHSRLNRITAAHFGDEAYSREELTAEIGAAYICHRLGLETPEQFRNSAGYIQGWLHALKDDPRMIVYAAARAEKAARLILNETETEAAPETDGAAAAV